MSEQVGGHLQLPSSYDFQRNSVSHYRNNSIDSNTFHQWVKDNMYTSSYAKHHSPVYLHLFRNLLLLALTTFRAMADSFLLIGLKVYMRRPSPIKPKISLLNLTSLLTGVAWQQQASTSLKMHSLISQKMPPAINMARLKSKGRILDGS